MENKDTISEIVLRENARKNWGRFTQAASRSYIPPHFIDTSAKASKEVSNFLKEHGIVNARLVVQATARRLFNNEFATLEEGAYSITYARGIAASKIWIANDQSLTIVQEGINILRKLNGNIFTAEYADKLRDHAAEVDRIKRMAEIACGLVLESEGTNGINTFSNLREWIEEYFSEISSQLKTG